MRCSLRRVFATFLMIGFVLLAVLFDRQGISMRLVAWAATAILILRPESLLGASFQLSFAAVIALIAVYEYLRERDELQPPRVMVLPAGTRRSEEDRRIRELVGGVWVPEVRIAAM